MMRRSLIFDATVRLVFDAALVLSVYLLFAGHNQPGGGFVGGLVAAAAISLRYVAGGIDDVLDAIPIRPWLFQSLGLLLAVGCAIWPLFLGEPPLDQRAIAFALPLLGDVKVTTAMVFDTGVYLIVVGLILMIFEGLGDAPVGDAVDESTDRAGDRTGERSGGEQ
ncbi:MAG TPA: MnhB domain-containing protein [Microthrixaceae bacterium]|nr:MnhB domain-containing protein [Microthrixaceae bacterium]